MPTRFDFVRVEQDMYRSWEEAGLFSPVPNAEHQQPTFTVAMPPPNVTGGLHMGHAMFSTLEDILTRFHRMRGARALYIPGTDHAGIATQLMVERALASEGGPTRQQLGRQRFLDRVWAWKREKGDYISQQLRRLGASCDWTREKFTLDPDMCAAVTEAFVRLHERGLIYRGAYMVNWSPNLMTAVSDLEVDSVEEQGSMYYFKYMLVGSDADGPYIPVATTRPETILGDSAVCVHPDDERYRNMIGKDVMVPFVGRRIPVIADTYVERDFGTGALKITPGHDYNDYDIGKRHGLPVHMMMDRQARIVVDDPSSAAYALFHQLDRFECRRAIWAELEKAGQSIKVEPHTLRVPRSQRGGEVVEPMVSNQWFVRTESMAAPALDAVRTGQVQILPERFEKVYYGWLENIHDWCISRQLWWGHRIPVWYVQGGDHEGEYIVARSEDDARDMVIQRYGTERAATLNLVQDEDVLDTWFSSGLWPFASLGWPNESSPDYQAFYPNTVLETGYDILFFWVARMMMMGIELTGKAPFRTIYLHGLVRDAQGRKMSKTTGNVIDPVETIDQYGTDALRYALVTGTTPGQDIPLSLEKIEANRNFVNKLWNAGRYIVTNLEKMYDPLGMRSADEVFSEYAHTIHGLPLPERYIVSRVHQVAQAVTEGLELYNFGEPGKLIYEFLWDEFADWYIEASKTRLYADKNQAKLEACETLVYVLDVCLRLLHPFMPFVTESIWLRLPHGQGAPTSIMLSCWPAQGPVDCDAIARFQRLQRVVRAVRNARAEYQVEPGRRITALFVSEDASTVNDIREEIACLALLARLDVDTFQAGSLDDVNPPRDDSAVHLIVENGLDVFLPMRGMIDFDKERQRLAKQLDRVERDLQGLAKRLDSPGFAKAPANVVEATQLNAQRLNDQAKALRQRLVEVEAIVAQGS